MMNLTIDPSLGGLTYLIIFLAAVIEGEVVFATASVLAGLGQLDGRGVLLAGALGGSAGDQLFFYLSRGPVRRWLSGISWLAPRREWIVSRVRSHATGMILAGRFLPGLRGAIPVSCAFADVHPLKFTTLNMISALAWASTVLELVTRWGPNLSSLLGLKGWWGIVLPAVFLLVFVFWISRKMTDHSSQNIGPSPDQESVRWDQ
jgi:membrane protein DedA with SNARE-associated domain